MDLREGGLHLGFLFVAASDCDIVARFPPQMIGRRDRSTPARLTECEIAKLRGRSGGR
jgi:hypothetical protein